MSKSTISDMIHEVFKNRNGLKKQYEKGSRKASIRVFCLCCVGNSSREVQECTDTLCPLYKWRLTG